MSKKINEENKILLILMIFLSNNIGQLVYEQIKMNFSICKL